MNVSSASDFSNSSSLFRRVPALKGLPERLLCTPAAVQNVSDQTRTPTPLAREYFKRVKFKDQGDQAAVDCEQGTECHFSWRFLTSAERTKLAECVSGLVEGNERRALASLERLRYRLFDELPPETFLQRPRAVKCVLEKLLYSSSTPIRTAAAETLKDICDRIMAKIDFVSQHQVETSKATSVGNNATDEVDDESLMDESGLEDRVNVIVLKQEAITPQEFSVICLSAIGVALGDVQEEETDLLEEITALFDSVRRMALQTGLQRLGHRTSKEAVQIRGIMQNVTDDLSSSLNRQRQRAFRVGVLVCMECLVTFTQTFFSSGEVNLADVADSIVLDETVFLSHPDMHRKCLNSASMTAREGWDSFKNSLNELARAIMFLKSESELPAQDAQAALKWLNLHQSPKFVPECFKLFESKHISAKEKYLLLTNMLKIDDLASNTAVYLSLHSLVRESLGLARLVSVSPEKSFNVLFVTKGEEVIKQVIEKALDQESRQVSKACQEILLYLMKAESSILPKELCRVIWTCLEKTLPWLECFTEASSTIGRAMSEILSNKESWEERLSPLSVLQGNMRLLFGKNPSARKLGMVNLKMTLSQESQSHKKLPPFQGILDADNSDLLANAAPNDLYLRHVNTSCETDVDEVVTLMESIAMNNIGSKSDWMRLEVLLHDRANLEKFFDLNGGPFLHQTLAQIILCKDENDTQDGSVNSRVMVAMRILPKWIPVAKLILLNERSRPLGDNEDFMLLLCRITFFPFEDPVLRSDLATAIFFALFRDQISTDDFGKVHFPAVLVKQIRLPFNCVTKEGHELVMESGEVANEYQAMVKTFWNVAYYGETKCCESDGQQQANLHASSGTFAHTLILSTSEKNAIRESFAETAFNRAETRLSEAKSHKAFISSLKYLACQLRIRGDEDFGSYPLKFVARVFRRFFLKRPRTRNDREVLLQILKFAWRTLRHYPNCTAHFTWMIEVARDFKTALLFMSSDFGSKLGYRELYQLREFYQALQRSFPGAGADLFSNLTEEFRPVGSLDIGTMNFVLSTSSLTHHAMLKWWTPYDVNSFFEIIKSSRQCSLSLPINILQSIDMIFEDGRPQLVQAVEANVKQILSLLDESDDPVVRALALQICSRLACYKEGALALTSADPNLWDKLVERSSMVSSELTYTREKALTTLTRLLLVSDNLNWFGPVIVEPISGVSVASESALPVFMLNSGAWIAISKILTELKEEERQLLAWKISLGTAALTLTKVAADIAPNKNDCVKSIVANAVEKLIYLKDSAKCFTEEWMLYVIVLLDFSKKNDLFPSDKELQVLAALVFLLKKGAKNPSMTALLRRGIEVMPDVLRKQRSSDLGMNELAEKYIFQFAHVLVENQTAIEEFSTSFYNFVAALSKYVVWAKFQCSASGAQAKLEQGDSESSLSINMTQTLLSQLVLWPEQETDLHCGVIWSLRHLLAASPLAQEASLERGLLEKCTRSLELLSAEIHRQPSAKYYARLARILALLTNFTYANAKVKEAAAASAIFDPLKRILVRWPERKFPRTLLIRFLLTASSFSPHFQQALCRNRPLEEKRPVGIKNYSSLLHFTVDICSSTNGSYFSDSLRLLMVLSQVAEARRVICRSGLLHRLRQQQTNRLEIPSLDLLLSLTSFSDGQMHVFQTDNLLWLLPLASQEQRASVRLSALAVLRNLAMNNKVANWMIHCTEVLDLLRKLLDTRENTTTRELSLQLTWALVHNRQKAKTIFKEKQFTELLKAQANVAASSKVYQTVMAILKEDM